MSHPNDPKLKSFIDVAPDSDFPIQNLPYGVFSTPASSQKRVGVAIGEFVLDLAALESEGLLKAGADNVFAQGGLNAFMDGDKIELEVEGLGRLHISVRDDLKRTWGRETRLEMQGKNAPGGHTPQLTGKYAPAAAAKA